MKEHVSYSYSFAELDEAAQRKALEAVAERRSGVWWDATDNELIGEVITMAFAESIGAPGTDKYGVSDYPGITGVKLESWCCNYDQGDHAGFAGHLTRENAPKLPWADGIASVTLESPCNHTSKWFVMDEAECICDGFSSVREPDCEAHTPNPASESQVQAMRDAIDAALHAAHRAGYDEIEHIGSEDSAREWIDSNEPEFEKDGSLFA